MNKIPIFSLTLLFALILPLFANAQVTVKGIVTDESGGTISWRFRPL